MYTPLSTSGSPSQAPLTQQSQTQSRYHAKTKWHQERPNVLLSKPPKQVQSHRTFLSTRVLVRQKKSGLAAGAKLCWSVVRSEDESAPLRWCGCGACRSNAFSVGAACAAQEIRFADQSAGRALGVAASRVRGTNNTTQQSCLILWRLSYALHATGNVDVVESVATFWQR